MAVIDISNMYGSGLDMSAYSDDGWFIMPNPIVNATLYYGTHFANLNAYGYASYNSVSTYYTLYSDNSILLYDLYYYRNSNVVLSIDDINVVTSTSALQSPSLLVRYTQGNDILHGNDYADYIKGGPGNDYIAGYLGNDAIYGNDNNDTLSGGGGDDRIVGGSGFDTASYGGASTNYVFAENSDGSITVVDRTGGWGTDNVIGVESFDFSDGVFSLASLLPVIGDASSNILYGTDRNNTIQGFGGNDRISGGPASERISGGTGNDVLAGGAGQDVFVFDTKLGSHKTNRKLNFDKITDFNVRDDSIQLDNAIFKKLGKGSEASPMKLSKAFFTIGDKAKDRNDYLVFNKTTGVLAYDADGSGAGKMVEFASLKKALKITFQDFFVI